MNYGQSSQMARLWEVDLIRGMAVVSMVIFHLAFDLNYLGILRIDLDSALWFYLARLTASLFLLLVGISLTLSHSRAVLTGQLSQYPSRLWKRSLWILCLALGVTSVTYILIGRGYIIFGILHLISISILLAYPLLSLGRMNIALGLGAILLGLHIQGMEADSLWLIWLGLAPRGFVSLDYTPLFPWFGMVLMGMATGSLLYRDLSRRFPLPEACACAPAKGLLFLGRNSLAVYILHQPLLLLLIYLLDGRSPLPFALAANWGSGP